LNLFKRILEVDPSCRDETIIRKAYLEKAKQYHPDSSFQDNKGDHHKFNQVQQAYEALIVNEHRLFLRK
jgi:DnaJ-class molecular chaperone